jgi:hypothetical protein
MRFGNIEDIIFKAKLRDIIFYYELKFNSVTRFIPKHQIKFNMILIKTATMY